MQVSGRVLFSSTLFLSWGISWAIPAMQLQHAMCMWSLTPCVDPVLSLSCTGNQWGHVLWNRLYKVRDVPGALQWATQQTRVDLSSAHNFNPGERRFPSWKGHINSRHSSAPSRVLHRAHHLAMLSVPTTHGQSTSNNARPVTLERLWACPVVYGLASAPHLHSNTEQPFCP